MGTKLSESRKKANRKWDAENLKRLSLAMLTPDFEKMTEHIAKVNENRNHFINRAIMTTIELDNQREGVE